MKLIKYTFIALISTFVFALIVGLFLPSNYQVKESIIIDTPINIVFNEVNSLRQWSNWSPWQQKDANIYINYEGPESGVGCKMLWDSKNPKVGKGSQEIVKSVPNKHIQTVLKFAGWDGITKASWDFEEQEHNKTTVTWTFNSQIGRNILYKYMSLIFKPALKRDYAKGLQQLKKHAEQSYMK
ncbi:hypothetical protein Aasi_0268 [Candidatus Amoebophilus asiaticus 5a2]|uniref:Polyketide cyclase/dehydrase n=1 Tax=Amoebophilus asiaticus (strain 5a2) TaxID=452471 RepID=B3ER56_AMOA5|nr:SRPBCC family protein [Candidatus Amoebophilus asiaticus]ACE05708.1 hypothetical protein Aasi_0268 [Candidatus Amoebophilus asiaticus 5a2]